MELTLRRKPKTAPPAPGAGTDGATYPIPDPTKPSALLLPPFILDRVAETKTRRKALRISAAALALVMAAGVGAFGWAWTAERDLEVAKAEKQVADARVAEFIEVSRYFDGLTSRKAALTTALAGDVTFSAIAERLLTAAPGGVYLESMKFAPGAPCAGPDPFDAEAALGCVNLAGTALRPGDIGKYVDKLNTAQDPNLVEGAFVSNVSEGSGTSALSFTISVNYTLNALKAAPAEDTATTPQSGAEQ